MDSLATSVDHAGPHGHCPGPDYRRKLEGCTCYYPELVITSSITIDPRTKKIDTEVAPVLTERCRCCYGI